MASSPPATDMSPLALAVLPKALSNSLLPWKPLPWIQVGQVTLVSLVIAMALNILREAPPPQELTIVTITEARGHLVIGVLQVSLTLPRSVPLKLPRVTSRVALGQPASIMFRTAFRELLSGVLRAAARWWVPGAKSPPPSPVAWAQLALGTLVTGQPQEQPRTWPKLALKTSLPRIRTPHLIRRNLQRPG